MTRVAFSAPSWWLVLVAVLWAAPGHGQVANSDGPAAARKDTTTTAREYPYAMPELPALAFIGAGAPKITRPVMPRALATELVNGIDSAGRVKQGLAVAIAPWALLGQRITLSQYQKDYGKYLAANTQVSLGTVRVAGNAAATDLGLGLRLTLLDGSDPMRAPEFTDSVRRMLLRTSPRYDPQDATPAEIEASMKINVDRVAKAQAAAAAAHEQVAAAAGAARAAAEQAAQAADYALVLAQSRLVKAQGDVIILTQATAKAQADSKAVNAQIVKYRQAWRNKYWNAYSLTVAGATGWRLNESELAPAADNRLLGWSCWATGGMPLGGSDGQLLLQARYANQRQFLAADNRTATDNQFNLGGRAVFGSASVNFYVEYTYTTHSNPLPGIDKARDDVGGGIEFRTTEGMWVSTGFGQKLLSNSDKAEPILIFAGLRWQLASAPRFAR